MAYVKFKEVTKNFDFSRAFRREELPGYIKHYVPEDENLLVAYKTSRDHGVFTDKKMVLFDHVNVRESYKQIYTIPYTSISMLSITFGDRSAELNFYLECGMPLKLRFIDMEPRDKVRLRLLYTCINRVVNGQDCLENDVDRLKNDEVGIA